MQAFGAWLVKVCLDWLSAILSSFVKAWWTIHQDKRVAGENSKKLKEALDVGTDEQIANQSESLLNGDRP